MNANHPEKSVCLENELCKETQFIERRLKGVECRKFYENPEILTPCELTP